MLRFILTGLCLLQFQVTYSSYVCQESKPASFSTYDQISTNEIRDEPFCSKEPKQTFMIFRSKPLHRFQPFFQKHHEFSASTLSENPQTTVSTSTNPEQRPTEDFCAIKSQEATQTNNVPEMLVGVETPPTATEETSYENESSKQCNPPVGTQDRYGQDLPCESSPEHEVVSSSCPFSCNTESQEVQSSLNSPDNNPYAQCPSPAAPPNYETQALNPSSITTETDRGISAQPSEAIQSEYDGCVQKHECSEPLESSGESIGSSGTTQINPITIEGETQLQVAEAPISSQQESSQSFPAQPISLDAACDNVSSVSTVEADEGSTPLINTQCVNPTPTPLPVVKESFSGTTISTSTDLGQISCAQESSGIPNKLITTNPSSTVITNQCSNILSNMIAGLSSISSTTSPSFVKPIYEEVIRHVPTFRNFVRHHLVETTHHVPIVEKIVEHERQDIIRHIPVVQKFTRNVVEYCKKHIPVVKHRIRTIQEPYVENVPHTEKITRPVVETLVKHVPVVFSQLKPVVHERIRHVPTVETRLVPVVEETVATVPVKQKVIKHIVEERIRSVVEPCEGVTFEKTLTPPSIVSLGLDPLCKY